MSAPESTPSATSGLPVRPRAMILAAGFGTRLGRLTTLRPKPMLPVAGAPLVRWAALWLRHHGVEDVVVNLHHLGEQIEAELGDGGDLDLRVAYSPEHGQILGTGGGLRQARPLLAPDGAAAAPIVTVNGKILVDLDLGAVLARHDELRARHGVEATMVLRADLEGLWKGDLRSTPDGRLARLLGELGPGMSAAQAEAGPPLMFTGVAVMEPSFLDRIPPQGEQCVVRTAYRAAFAEGRVGTYLTDGYWWEHSTVERYLAGVRNVLDGVVQLPYAEGTVVGVDPRAELHPAATVVGPVHVGPGAVIEAGATVGPHAQVGAGAVVRAGASLRDAVAWPGAEVRGQVERDVVV